MCAIPEYNRNGIVGNFTVVTVTVDNSCSRGVTSSIGNEKRGFSETRFCYWLCAARAASASPETCMPFHSDFMTAPSD
jgi:hypothetical protein